MLNNADWFVSNTGDISVSAYQELIDDDSQHKLWGCFLRIENNSDEPITLLRKDFCLTDEKGTNRYDCSDGFNGELPDLQPGEYFEYEQTATTDSIGAILYGFCSAVTANGKKLKIAIPVIDLSSKQAALLN